MASKLAMRPFVRHDEFDRQSAIRFATLAPDCHLCGTVQIAGPAHQHASMPHHAQCAVDGRGIAFQGFGIDGGLQLVAAPQFELQKLSCRFERDFFQSLHHIERRLRR